MREGDTGESLGRGREGEGVFDAFIVGMRNK